MMRRLGVVMAVAVMTGCSANRQTVRQQVHSEQVRADSLTALMAEDLHVSLHDVVIARADSPQVRVYVKAVELTRDRAARVETQSLTQTQTEAVAERQPAPAASPIRRLSFALGALASAFCLLALRRLMRLRG